MCGYWCVYMTEWVSGGGQGSLGCHRLPPHRNNKALFVALSLSLYVPSTFFPLCICWIWTELWKKGIWSHATSLAHWHMTKKQITADEATALKAVTARSRGAEGELDELRRRLRKMKVMEGVCSRHSIKKKKTGILVSGLIRSGERAQMQETRTDFHLWPFPMVISQWFFLMNTSGITVQRQLAAFLSALT